MYLDEYEGVAAYVLLIDVGDVTGLYRELENLDDDDDKSVSRSLSRAYEEYLLTLNPPPPPPVNCINQLRQEITQ